MRNKFIFFLSFLLLFGNLVLADESSTTEPIFDEPGPPEISEPVFEIGTTTEPEISEPVFETGTTTEPEISEPVFEIGTTTEPEISEPVFEIGTTTEPEISEPVFETGTTTEPEISEPVFETGNGFLILGGGGEKIITAYGDAQIDTAFYKFETGAGLFDGSGDYLTTPNHTDWSFGTGDFTIDFWVRFDDMARDDFIFSARDAGILGWNIRHYEGTSEIGIRCSSPAEYIYTSGAGLEEDNWYHIAFVHFSGTFKIYVNGVEKYTSSIVRTFDADSGSLLRISNYQDIFFAGHLDEVRISKGIARWTANFTPPTVAYPCGDEYTGLLLHMDGEDGSKTFLDSSITICEEVPGEFDLDSAFFSYFFEMNNYLPVLFAFCLIAVLIGSFLNFFLGIDKKKS